MHAQLHDEGCLAMIALFGFSTIGEVTGAPLRASSIVADGGGGGNTARDIVRIDPNHPATKDWTKTQAVVDEFYQFRNFDRSKAHALLDMDFEGTMLPVAWSKTHGKGRVFYSSMGHRDDVLLPDIPSLDYGNGKQNANEICAAYQKHVLGRIRWALGLVNAE